MGRNRLEITKRKIANAKRKQKEKEHMKVWDKLASDNTKPKWPAWLEAYDKMIGLRYGEINLFSTASGTGKSFYNYFHSFPVHNNNNIIIDFESDV